MLKWAKEISNGLKKVPPPTPHSRNAPLYTKRGPQKETLPRVNETPPTKLFPPKLADHLWQGRKVLKEDLDPDYFSPALAL